MRGNEGGDPSAVIFDAVERATARHIDLVLGDTAGRLHTKTNLMEELRKVRRVAAKGAGRVTEVLLVIDATTLSLSAGVYEYAFIEVINGGALEVNGLVEIIADDVYIDASSMLDGRGRGAPARPGRGAAAGPAVSGAAGRCPTVPGGAGRSAAPAPPVLAGGGVAAGGPHSPQRAGAGPAFTVAVAGPPP